MSITVAHRHHVRVPWLPIIVVLAIAVTAVLIALLTVGSSGTTPATNGTQALDTAIYGEAQAAAPWAVPASPKYCRAPRATGSASALALPAPAAAKYCRAPWAAGDIGPQNR